MTPRVPPTCPAVPLRRLHRPVPLHHLPLGRRSTWVLHPLPPPLRPAAVAIVPTVVATGVAAVLLWWLLLLLLLQLLLLAGGAEARRAAAGAASKCGAVAVGGAHGSGMVWANGLGLDGCAARGKKVQCTACEVGGGAHAQRMHSTRLWCMAVALGKWGCGCCWVCGCRWGAEPQAPSKGTNPDQIVDPDSQPT